VAAAARLFAEIFFARNWGDAKTCHGAVVRAALSIIESRRHLTLAMFSLSADIVSFVRRTMRLIAARSRQK
jgi:hypothetical protein